jgi:hypothetical protein
VAEEPITDEGTAPPWPRQLHNLRHSDQLRAVLADMPRPSGKPAAWLEIHVENPEPAEAPGPAALAAPVQVLEVPAPVEVVEPAPPPAPLPPPPPPAPTVEPLAPALQPAAPRYASFGVPTSPAPFSTDHYGAHPIPPPPPPPDFGMGVVAFAQQRRRRRWVLVVLLVLVMAAAGAAGALYYRHDWPFRTHAPATQQQSLTLPAAAAERAGAAGAG